MNVPRYTGLSEDPSTLKSSHSLFAVPAAGSQSYLFTNLHLIGHESVTTSYDPLLRDEPIIWGMVRMILFGLNPHMRSGTSPFYPEIKVIQSERLSMDAIMFHVRGPFQKKAAKELGLSVFRSHRLGFTTFHFDLTRASLIDEQGARHLALIGQGVQDKGGEWKTIGHPPLLKNHLLVDATFDYPPQELWN